MNYRHAFHAGNFADVLKHIVLALCLEHLKKKSKPFCYIDTHAGLGRYDLTSDAAQRSPEWKDGVLKVLSEPVLEDMAAIIAPWRSVIAQLNAGPSLTQYPGSPEIAARLLRQSERMHLCELHRDDARQLDRLYAKDARVKVLARDGYQSLKSLIPPKEKRGLVLIDPPFEDRDEMAFMAEASLNAIKRWPGGTYIFWRPLKDLWASERFDIGLAEWLIEEQGFGPEKILRADLWVRELESDGKLAGAGVVVINPPFTLEPNLLKLLPWLCKLFKQDKGSGWRLDGAITEDSLPVDQF